MWTLPPFELAEIKKWWIFFLGIYRIKGSRSNTKNWLRQNAFMLKCILKNDTTIKVDGCIFYSNLNALPMWLWTLKTRANIHRSTTNYVGKFVEKCIKNIQRDRMKETKYKNYLKCKLSSTIYSEACLPSLESEKKNGRTVPCDGCLVRTPTPSMAIIIKILYWYILCVQWFVVAVSHRTRALSLSLCWFISAKSKHGAAIIEFLLSRTIHRHNFLFSKSTKCDEHYYLYPCVRTLYTTFALDKIQLKLRAHTHKQLAEQKLWENIS